jgi:hypothetical protein
MGSYPSIQLNDVGPAKQSGLQAFEADGFDDGRTRSRFARYATS